MLYFADRAHYRQFLSPITGAQYVALERGPAVNDYKRLFDEMVSNGTLSLHKATILGRRDKKYEYLPKKEPNRSVFTPSELRVLDAVVAEHGVSTGIALSEATHREGPWTFVWDPYRPGLPIPYVLFRWLDNMPDEADLEAAKKDLARSKVSAKAKALSRQAAA